MILRLLIGLTSLSVFTFWIFLFVEAEGLYDFLGSRLYVNAAFMTFILSCLGAALVIQRGFFLFGGKRLFLVFVTEFFLVILVYSVTAVHHQEEMPLILVHLMTLSLALWSPVVGIMYSLRLGLRKSAPAHG